MDNVLVSIPHGLEYKGNIIQHARLRELNGHDEHYITSEGNNLPVSILVTKFLSRLLKFENESEKTGSKKEEMIRNLSIGDRVYLLLQVRRLTFGDTMQCILVCPSCTQVISFDMDVKKLLEPKIRPWKKDVFTIGGYTVKIRPLRGVDEESLLENDNSDKSVHTEYLVRSCIISSNPPLPKKLADDFILQISEKLEELDPMADIVLDLSCPSCSNSFNASFPVEEFIFQEISTRLHQHDREIHWLAFNYHWDEEKILSLPLQRRKKYVDLINKTLSGEAL